MLSLDAFILHIGLCVIVNVSVTVGSLGPCSQKYGEIEAKQAQSLLEKPKKWGPDLGIWDTDFGPNGVTKPLKTPPVSSRQPRPHDNIWLLRRNPPLARSRPEKVAKPTPSQNRLPAIYPRPGAEILSGSRGPNHFSEISLLLP